MKKLLTNLIVIIAVAVVAIIGTLLVSNGKLSFGSKSDIIAIQGTIENIGELATSEYIYTSCDVHNNDAKKLFGIELGFTASRGIYCYDGVIKAGIDFEKIDIKNSNGKIVVKMPEAEILSNEVKEESLRTLDEKNFIFNKLSMDDYSDVVSELKSAAEEKAIENGLLKNAENNAEEIIENTIKGLCGNSVRVEFE